MSKKITNGNREPIDESNKDNIYDMIEECLEAAADFLRTHPNYYDHSNIPSGNLTTAQFIEWWKNRRQPKSNI